MGIEAWDARNAGEKSVGIVFTDVDGTLVDADHHPIASTAPVMAEVAARVPVCLVSARSPEGLYPIQEALGFTGNYGIEREGGDSRAKDIGLAAERLLK